MIKLLCEDDKRELEEKIENLKTEIVNPIEGISIFKNKTASFYGDSLTEVNYHYTKGYHAWIKEILGLASINNYGVSGYKVSNIYSKVNSVTDSSDIIFVMCGVNDQNFSVPLGVISDTTVDTTYGALNLLCALLKEKYPSKLVVFITPHYQTKYPHNSGITSYEVSKAIREVCEKYAIPVYDNFLLSGIYTTNLSHFTTDNCHWNDVAHEMVGKNISRFMLNTFGYVYSDTHEHSYTETVSKAATCTTTGVKTFTCECGESYTESIPATGHKWDNGVVTTAPTEQSEGVKTFTCTVCGETYTETIAALGHEHSYVSTVVEPTCTEQGYINHVCACGDSYKDTYTAATGHNYVDGVCSACGAVDPDYEAPTPEFAPVTMEVTGHKVSPQFHLCLYMESAALESFNGELKYGCTITPLTEFTPTIVSKTGGVFKTDTMGNLTAGYDFAVQGAENVNLVDNQNGTYKASINWGSKSATASRNYWCFPLNIGIPIGSRFTVSNAYIKIADTYYEIHAIDSAFVEETYTLE